MSASPPRARASLAGEEPSPRCSLVGKVKARQLAAFGAAVLLATTAACAGETGSPAWRLAQEPGQAERALDLGERSRIVAAQIRLRSAARVAAEPFASRVHASLTRLRNQLDDAHRNLVAQQRISLEALWARKSGGRHPMPRSLDGKRVRKGGPPLRILSIDHDGGEPEEWVHVTGSGFVPGVRVRFRLGPQVERVADAEVWDASNLVVQVPREIGLLPYAGGLRLEGPGLRRSSFISFIVHPLQEAQLVDPWALVASTEVGGSEPLGRDRRSVGECVLVSHCTSGAARGTDVVGSGMRLKNGWVVDHADVEPLVLEGAPPYAGDSATRAPRGQDGSRLSVRLDDSSSGTDLVSTQLSWATTPIAGDPLLAACGYLVMVTARGPAGVPCW